MLANLNLKFSTFILKTEKGYQAYFVLEEPAYVTNRSQFKVLKVAKAISQNLRNYFAEELPVDMTCNHFGIARMPRPDNMVFFQEEYVYSFEEWMNWSMKQSNLPFPNKKPNLTVLSGTEGIKQIDEPWYQLLLKESTIKGAKALMGRNNVLFTLALANFSSGVSQGDCEVVLNDFNGQLDEPLHSNELLKLIASAYSGKYEAASREYIMLLCKAWVNKQIKHTDLFTNQRWYKFKKNRSERKYSHLSEWKADLLAYLEADQSSTEPYLQINKQVLKEAIGIPIRSLDKVLKILKQEQKILYSVKKGRGGGLRVVSIKRLWVYLIQLKKEAKG
ncbi:RepE/RepS primase family protein [Streptococcus pneumoniae]|nr:hypothetical protein FE152_09765 [Streptococcus pneumoniae]CEW48655.1 RepE/RepS primase family protein [Streptococcus pneumoniae]CJD47685.1 RepE/RepS primase family protein [Streptococcus pneumoniae]CJS23701.1 RepE/RepS primase family protein [Streptococcus pneumoniae]VPN95189.1 RepE/RepS primase family protein [Streptococcus pneumoniae]